MLMNLHMIILKLEVMITNNINIDYDDIYDNLDDYEYPYNHINKGEL